MRLKDRYLRWLSFYRKHAKNTAYCVYFPEYIHSYQHPGPYFSADVLFGKRKDTIWEEMRCRIPTDPDAVLRNYYGEDWQTPPFQTKQAVLEALQKEQERQGNAGNAAKGRWGAAWRSLLFGAKRKQKEKTDQEWYSEASVGITVLKHLSNVVFADDTYARNGEDSQ